MVECNIVTNFELTKKKTSLYKLQNNKAAHISRTRNNSSIYRTLNTKVTYCYNSANIVMIIFIFGENCII